MARRELLEAMHVGRAKLMKLIGDLPEAVATSSRSIGEWSIKDIVSHMLVWEEVAAGRLALVRDGRDQEIRYIDAGELDDWNARAVVSRRDLSWQETLSELATVRERLKGAMEAIEEERLMAEVEPVPIYRWLPNFTYAHEEEHIAEIADWLKQKGC